MDISEIDFEIIQKGTLAEKHDFEALRMLNIDEDSSPLSKDVDVFLDWSFALLRRTPVNWREYLAAVPNDLQSLFDETEKLLQNIKAVATAPPGARGAKLSKLSSRIQNRMNRNVSSTAELMMILMIGSDRQENPSSQQERAEKSLARLDRLIAKSRTRAGELEEMADASKEVTAKIAASGKARVFHTEGQTYAKAARLWLAATVGLGLVLMFLAFGFALGWIIELEAGADAGQIATHLFGKVLILVTVGAGLTFSARQYSANRHNAVQNYHRSSALRTYRALLSATRDEAVHEAILQQAAQAIFSPSDTGYSKHAAQYDQSPIVQLVQGMTKDGPSAS